MGRRVQADRALQGYQEVQVIQADPLFPSLQNDWWKSRHLGLPWDQVNRVGPADPELQESLQIPGTPSHPLSRCSRALPWAPGVRPVLADPEVLEFLGILVNRQDP